MTQWTIYKYAVEMTDEFTVVMGANAIILSVQVQHGTPQMWVLVHPRAKAVERRFAVYGTGNPVAQPDWQFVGTFQLYGGDLVFHLFAEPERASAAAIGHDR